MAATNEEEEREESGGEKERQDGFPGTSSTAEACGTGVLERWDCKSLRSVMAELDNIEDICNKFIQKFSSSGPCSSDNLQVSPAKQESERSIRPGNERHETIPSQRMTEIKGEGISRSFQGNCDQAFPNVPRQISEHPEETKDDFVIGPENVKRGEEKKCPNSGNFNREPEVLDAIALSTPGSKAERSCSKAETCKERVLPVIRRDSGDADGCAKHQTTKETGGSGHIEPDLVMSEVEKKVKAYWEQIARLISGNVMAAVIVRGSPAKPSLLPSGKQKRSPVPPQELDKEDKRGNLDSENRSSNQNIPVTTPALLAGGGEQVDVPVVGTQGNLHSESRSSNQIVPVTPPALPAAGGEQGDVPVEGTHHPTLDTNNMPAAQSHEMQKEDKTRSDVQKLKVSAKKALRHAAKSRARKISNSSEIPKEKEFCKKKDKKKVILTGKGKPKKKRKLQNRAEFEEDSFTEGGRDELKKQESSGNTELSVQYERYMWKADESTLDGERESSMASVWEHMALARATAPRCPAEAEISQVCEHVTIDWDEEVGWYCEDCGCRGERTKLKACLHENRLWKDEVGQYCEDCGLAGTDIQNIFIPENKLPPSRKQTDLNRFKDYETADGKELQFNLQVPPRNDLDFSEARLELHPVFEQKLHSHQKDGFNFLADNLLGEKQGNSVGCILAHAPGTGKTCLMISFIQSFLTRFSEGRVLILAPKIMLKSWQNEFALWKVDIPVYCLNEWTFKENVPGAEYELQETLEHYAEIPAHVKKSLKENRARVLEEWKGGKGVLVMSYALFAIMIDRGLDARVALDTLISQMCRVVLDAPDLIVLDEGHLARTKQTKILKSLRQMRTRRRVILSGTLFHNNFKELYTLLKLCRDNFMKAHPFCSQLMSKRFGHHNKLSVLQQEENTFQEEIGEVLERHVKNGTGADGEINQAVEKLRLLTASFVHWYPGKILESLPGLVEYSVLLNLSDVQKRVISSFPPLTTGNNNTLAIRNKVFSACIHPSLVMKHHTKNPYFDTCASHETEPLVTGDYDEAFQGVKIEFLIRLLHLSKQSREKMVVFCNTLGPLNYIQDMLQSKWGWKLGQQFLRLDGTMTEVHRQEVIRLFNLLHDSDQDSGGPRQHLLLASTKACKEGISLVGASRVVILDNHDNPSVLRQAVSRAFRIGQKKVVFVYRLLANHKAETDLFQRSVNKEILSKVLLDTLNHTTAVTQMEEFLRPIHSTSEVEDDLLQKLMRLDDKGRIINTIHRYNASGSFKGQAADCR